MILTNRILLSSVGFSICAIFTTIFTKNIGTFGSKNDVGFDKINQVDVDSDFPTTNGFGQNNFGLYQTFLSNVGRWKINIADDIEPEQINDGTGLWTGISSFISGINFWTSANDENLEGALTQKSEGLAESTETSYRWMNFWSNEVERDSGVELDERSGFFGNLIHWMKFWTSKEDELNVATETETEMDEETGYLKYVLWNVKTFIRQMKFWISKEDESNVATKEGMEENGAISNVEAFIHRMKFWTSKEDESNNVTEMDLDEQNGFFGNGLLNVKAVIHWMKFWTSKEDDLQAAEETAKEMNEKIGFVANGWSNVKAFIHRMKFWTSKEDELGDVTEIKPGLSEENAGLFENGWSNVKTIIHRMKFWTSKEDEINGATGAEMELDKKIGWFYWVWDEKSLKSSNEVVDPEKGFFQRMGSRMSFGVPEAAEGDIATEVQLDKNSAVSIWDSIRESYEGVKFWNRNDEDSGIDYAHLFEDMWSSVVSFFEKIVFMVPSKDCIISLWNVVYECNYLEHLHNIWVYILEILHVAVSWITDAAYGLYSHSYEIITNTWCGVLEIAENAKLCVVEMIYEKNDTTIDQVTNLVQNNWVSIKETLQTAASWIGDAIYGLCEYVHAFVADSWKGISDIAGNMKLWVTEKIYGEEGTFIVTMRKIQTVCGAVVEMVTQMATILFTWIYNWLERYYKPVVLGLLDLMLYLWQDPSGRIYLYFIAGLVDTYYMTHVDNRAGQDIISPVARHMDSIHDRHEAVAKPINDLQTAINAEMETRMVERYNGIGMKLTDIGVNAAEKHERLAEMWQESHSLSMLAKKLDPSMSNEIQVMKIVNKYKAQYMDAKHPVLVMPAKLPKLGEEFVMYIEDEPSPFGQPFTRSIEESTRSLYSIREVVEPIGQQPSTSAAFY